ncbi:MAG: helix-turn-helix domain-containing protein [Oscillospiraceae bacterium]|jgi:transcriptional regulator with XRE-family HTH domain
MGDASFSRILTLLRKERGITQKEAAANLGISQALLSHYEKGIRECGLSFVVKVADYYGVSCDYLLGRSPDRSGLTLSVEDIPDKEPSTDNKFQGSVLPVLNKKLIVNSLNILFDMLQKCSSKKLVQEVSNYLMMAVYAMFRNMFESSPDNTDAMFSVPSSLYNGYTDSSMSAAKARISAMLSDSGCAGIESVENRKAFSITTEEMSKRYPLYATSMLNLIQLSEKNIKK